jgi:hypothetical protein
VIWHKVRDVGGPHFGSCPRKASSFECRQKDNKVMIFTVFTLAGIGLCITRHRGWGIFCFVIAFITLVGTVL